MVVHGERSGVGDFDLEADFFASLAKGGFDKSLAWFGMTLGKTPEIDVGGKLFFEEDMAVVDNDAATADFSRAGEVVPCRGFCGGIFWILGRIF